MTSEQEEKVCMFCLESKRGKRNRLPIEFIQLFPCECRFQAHGECILRWQIHCYDDFQCPICRSSIVVPEEQGLQIVAVQIHHEPFDPIKKAFCFLMYYFLFVSFFFGFFGVVIHHSI